MARGDLTFFNAFGVTESDGTHDLDTHNFKVGIITTAVAPTAADPTPSWGDYSGNEVNITPNYSAGGPAVGSLTLGAVGNVTTVDWTTDVAILDDAGGSANAGWGILYNATNVGEEAIAFIDLGGPVDMAQNLSINGPLWDKTVNA